VIAALNVQSFTQPAVVNAADIVVASTAARPATIAFAAVKPSFKNLPFISDKTAVSHPAVHALGPAGGV
jgi:hypothetical protein